MDFSKIKEFIFSGYNSYIMSGIIIILSFIIIAMIDSSVRKVKKLHYSKNMSTYIGMEVTLWSTNFLFFILLSFSNGFNTVRMIIAAVIMIVKTISQNAMYKQTILNRVHRATSLPPGTPYQEVLDNMMFSACGRGKDFIQFKIIIPYKNGKETRTYTINFNENGEFIGSTYSGKKAWSELRQR